MPVEPLPPPSEPPLNPRDRLPPAEAPAEPDRGESDAALLVARVGGELASLSLAVDELQAALGPTLEAAAARDPGILQQAQQLDLVAQSLQGLSVFLAAMGRRRIGREPLDIEGAAATLLLASLGARLAGRTPGQPSDDLDLF